MSITAWKWDFIIFIFFSKKQNSVVQGLKDMFLTEELRSVLSASEQALLTILKSSVCFRMQGEFLQWFLLSREKGL